jgi:hypothetical protein
MTDWFAKDGGPVKARLDNLKKTAEQATEHIVKLMVIFVLQTLVIPLLLLWGLYGFVRFAFELPRHTSDVPFKR